ncbi:MAG: DUF1175 family protein [Thermotogota bacterium]|nr:DUF1175 family protein [Thermotogota bacterium]
MGVVKYFIFFLVLFILIFFHFFQKPAIINAPSGINDYLQISMPVFTKILRVQGGELLDSGRVCTVKLTEPSFELDYFYPGTFQSKGRLSFFLTFDKDDTDDDGFPDKAELYGEDCDRFRNWMVWIATNQKISPSPTWIHRDCSGLVRFSIVEALKKHDTGWINAFGSSPPNFEDVQAFNYPDIPLINSSLFLTSQGFHGFADARHLLLYNCEKVGNDLNEAKKGDLLFLYHPQDFVFPYHVMIVTDDGFVYHTGPDDESDGYVRLWKQEDYLDAAPLIWLPVKENPNFLGVFRLKILND